MTFIICLLCHSELAKNLKYYNFDVITPDSSQDDGSPTQNDKFKMSVLQY